MQPVTTSTSVPRRARRGPGRPRGGVRLTDRESVLDAAEALLAADGPGLTMDRLADAVAVTKPSLYRIVGDRQGLVEALGARFSGLVNERAAAMIDPATTGRDRLRQVLGAYVSVVDEHRGLYRFVASAASGQDRGAQLLAAADGNVPELRRSLEQLGLSPGRSRRWAYGVVGAALLMTLEWIRDDNGPIDDLAEELTDFVWSGLGVSERESADR